MKEAEEIARALVADLRRPQDPADEPRVKVLLVDDVPANLLALHAVLEDEDLDLVDAHSGDEALKHILDGDYAVILLDVQMPGLNGYETAKLIKQRERSREIPIIFVTAVNKEDSYVLHGYEVGAIDYLFKPFDLNILKSKVRVFVDLYRAHAKLRIQNETLVMQAELVRTHAQLVHQSNLLLQEGDRYKDEFLDVVSHELRTPLNFIMGFASVLVDGVQGPLNDDQRSSLEKILEGTERMLALVNDLLDMAKIQAGKFELDCHPVHYAGLVKQVLADLAVTAESKGVTLIAQVDPDLRPNLDGQRIRQTLYNLVGNGIKFTPAGGTVRVTAAVEGDSLVTRVKDSGIGVSPENLPKLFRRFKQLDMSKTRAAGGTGLGLYITKTLVEGHGGTVGAESDPGDGSTFWFALPLV
ncbi:MAG: ATP-binding region ATPase domain protein [Cyanobacteria bacterium RYN_339]|nr:ATP-binding region ATPase domain protein [Cyanobacteria bacterium RYN_339]